MVGQSRVGQNSVSVVSSLFHQNRPKFWIKHIINSFEKMQYTFKIAKDFFRGQKRDWNESIRFNGFLDRTLDASDRG